MNRWMVSIAFAALVAGVGTAWAQVQLRPGQYAATIDMDFAGTKISDTKTECITADDLADFPKKVLLGPELTNACKVANHAVSGSTVTLDMTCDEDGLKMTSRVEMTFTADSFTGISTSKDNRGRTTTFKISGKRIGECKP